VTFLKALTEERMIFFTPLREREKGVGDLEVSDLRRT